MVMKELSLARNQEIIKQELAARYDFNIERLFKEVDDWNYKYIDHKNLKRFLTKMGVPASEPHLIAIIRRFDMDADAKLTFSEFASGITPLLDFSKRDVKERISKPNVNHREFVLSPSRKSMVTPKNNGHPSPLRLRPPN